MIQKYIVDYKSYTTCNENGTWCKWEDAEKIIKIAFKNGIFALDMDKIWSMEYLDELYEKHKENIQRDFECYGE